MSQPSTYPTFVPTLRDIGFTIIACSGFALGAIVGFSFAFFAVDDANALFIASAEIQNACFNGNKNACEMYKADRQ